LVRVPCAAAVECAKKTDCFVYENPATQQQLLTVWDGSGTPSNSFATVSATITVKNCTIKSPVWVDLVSGGIYEFPAGRVARDGGSVVFKDVPVYDAPVLIAEKSLVLR